MFLKCQRIQDTFLRMSSLKEKNDNKQQTPLNESTPSLAYQVAHCQQIGRHLIAQKDLQKGEIIFQELPLASGPERNSPLICPGCFSAPNFSCEKCGWPICGPNCTGIIRHIVECRMIIRSTRQGQRVSGKNNWALLSDCLMIVRCLTLKSTEPKKWQALLNMENHWKEWSRSPLFERAESVVKLLRENYGISPQSHTTSEILNIQAALDINAYEVRMPEVNIQASYELASLTEHSCVPNTHRTISSESLLLTVRAAANITKGTHLSTSYCDILWPTKERQQYLQWSKFFICNCPRCLDSTELGSFLSALLCPTCSNDTPLLPELHNLTVAVDYTDNDKNVWKNISKDYKCTTCKKICQADFCQDSLEKAEDELQELDKDPTPEKCCAYETWVNKWSVVPAVASHNTSRGLDDENEPTCGKSLNENFYPKLLLHPQHSLVLDACHTLFLLYSKEESSSTKDLTRKENIGTHLLHSTSSIVTGVSKFRGTVLYELAMTKAALFLQFTEGSRTINGQMRQLAQESLQMLKESLEDLQYEPKDQPEGLLAQTAARQFCQLKSYLQELVIVIP